MAFNLQNKIVQFATFALISVAAATSNSTAHASKGFVTAKVDISEQRMRVYVNGVHKETFKVSTAGKGYRTPTGTWRPTRMHKMWYSRKYNNSPMPHSIFFYGGYAVHATESIGRLGRPASHGCIRLHPKNARKLFKLVLGAGRANTKITITR